MSKAADLMMVNAFVKKVKSGEEIKESSDNPLDIALSIWINSKTEASKSSKGRLSAFLPPECLKVLQDNDVVENFRNCIRPDTHVTGAKALVAFIKSRPHNSDFNLEYRTWQTHRNWYYSYAHKPEIQKKVSAIFADAGFKGLEKANLDSKQLRNLIYADQVVRWVELNKRMPNKANFLEKKMAAFIASPNHSFVSTYLEKNGVPVQKAQSPNLSSVSILPSLPNPNQFGGLKERIDRIETILEKIIDLLETKEFKKPKEKKWVHQFPPETFSGSIPESSLKGLATYQTKDGKQITVGIQNVMIYPSGNKKLILRFPNPNGTYGRVFYRWASDKSIKEVTMLQ